MCKGDYGHDVCLVLGLNPQRPCPNTETHFTDLKHTLYKGTHTRQVRSHTKTRTWLPLIVGSKSGCVCSGGPSPADVWRALCQKQLHQTERLSHCMCIYARVCFADYVRVNILYVNDPEIVAVLSTLIHTCAHNSYVNTETPIVTFWRETWYLPWWPFWLA